MFINQNEKSKTLRLLEKNTVKYQYVLKKDSLNKTQKVCTKKEKHKFNHIKIKSLFNDRYD